MAAPHLIHLDRPVVHADLEYLGDRAALTGPDDDTLVDAPAAVIGVRYFWDAERFARFPNLKVLSRAGIGYDNIDVAAARGRRHVARSPCAQVPPRQETPASSGFVPSCFTGTSG